MEEENLKYKTKKGLYWTLINQFANQGMTFLIGIIMARLLCPSDYGITALPAVFIGVAYVFIDGGLGLALVRKEKVTEEDLSTAFYYSIGVGIICYLCLFFTAPLIADFYNTPILVDLIRITALTFLWGPLGTPQGVILQRRLDFKTPARISVINKIVSSILGIIAAYCGYGLWALVIASLSSSLLGLIQTWWVVKWLPKAPFSKYSFKYLWNFGNKMIGVNLIDCIFGNITPIFIGKYYSTANLGEYNRALGYASLPPTQVTNMLNGITFPILSKVQGEDDKLTEAYRKMIKVANFIVFPIMIVIAVLARPLIIVIITEKWLACVVFLQLMCFWKMWIPTCALNLTYLQVKGRTDIYLKLEMFKKIHTLAIMLITLPIGINTFICGSIFNSFLCVIENTYFVGKISHYGTWKHIKDMLPTLLLSIFMGFIVYISISQLSSNLMQLIVGSIISPIVYFLSAYILKFDELQEVKYLLSTRK